MEKMIYGNLSRPKGVCCKMTGFCFKQKTAYEMRISDWSADVCSSDLRERQRAIAGVPARAIEKQILAGLKSEHRQRGKVVAPRFAAEQDREMRLHAPELARHGQRRHDVVAQFRPRVGADAQIAVGLVVEDGVAGHQIASLKRGGGRGAGSQRIQIITIGGQRRGERPRALAGVGEQTGRTFAGRSEEHTSELQSLMRNSYAVFCL